MRKLMSKKITIVGFFLLALAVLFAVSHIWSRQPLGDNDALELVFPEGYDDNSLVPGTYGGPTASSKEIHYRDAERQFYVALQDDRGETYNPWNVPYLEARFFPGDSAQIDKKGCRIPNKSSMFYERGELVATDTIFCTTHENRTEEDPFAREYYTKQVVGGYLVLSNRWDNNPCGRDFVETADYTCKDKNQGIYNSSKEVMERIIESVQTGDDYKNG